MARVNAFTGRAIGIDFGVEQCSAGGARPPNGRFRSFPAAQPPKERFRHSLVVPGLA